MILQPTRRDLIKYGLGVSFCGKMRGQSMLSLMAAGGSSGAGGGIAAAVTGDSFASGGSGGSSINLGTIPAGSFIVVATAYQGGPPSVTSALGSIFTGLTDAGASVAPNIRMYYATNSPGGAETITTGVASFIGACAAVFSGVSISTPLDKQDHVTDHNGTTLNPANGGILPSANGSLLIAVNGLGIGDTVTNNDLGAGFTKASILLGAGGTNYGLAMWYLIQSTAASVDPTITVSPSGVHSAAIGVWK